MKRSQVNHTQLSFEPLVISCSIKCDTPHSPLAQVSNALLNEYEPDRTVTPCVIRPYIIVKDKDEIFPDGNANERIDLQSIKWFLNGLDIKDIPEFANKFEIVKSDNELRGSLILKRNTPVTEKYNITFEAKFEDWRRGKIETTQSNELSMYSTDIGDDLFNIAIETPMIVYDPLKDNLLMYDWMLANDLITAGDRNAYKDSNSFEGEVNFLINSGKQTLKTLPSNITLKLYKKDGAEVVEGDTNFEVASIGYPTIKFDYRLIDKEEYEVKIFRDNKELSKESFSIRRERTQISECSPMFGNDLSPHQPMYFNEALVNLKDTTLTYPELYYDLVWFTQANIYRKTQGDWVKGEEKQHNWGRKLQIPIEDIGVGVTKNNNYFSVGFDAEQKKAFKPAVSNTGLYFTDEQGNQFII